MPRSLAERRYNTAALLLMTGYVVVLLGVTYWFHRAAPHGPVAVLLAVLPALPLIGVFATMGRYLAEERDEYRRLLAVRQVLVATGIALSAATAYGFLESFGVAPRIDSYWVAIVWFGGLGAGSCWNKLAERGDAA